MSLLTLVQQKTNANAIFNGQSFNDTLTNDFVSFGWAQGCLFFVSPRDCTMWGLLYMVLFVVLLLYFVDPVEHFDHLVGGDGAGCFVFLCFWYSDGNYLCSSCCRFVSFLL